MEREGRPAWVEVARWERAVPGAACRGRGAPCAPCPALPPAVVRRGPCPPGCPARRWRALEACVARPPRPVPRADDAARAADGRPADERAPRDPAPRAPARASGRPVPGPAWREAVPGSPPCRSPLMLASRAPSRPAESPRAPPRAAAAPREAWAPDAPRRAPEPPWGRGRDWAPRGAPAEPRDAAPLARRADPRPPRPRPFAMPPTLPAPEPQPGQPHRVAVRHGKAGTRGRSAARATADRPQGSR